MASEELDQLVANLRRLHLAHAAKNLDEHLKRAAKLKLGHLGFLARVIEAEVLARTDASTKPASLRSVASKTTTSSFSRAWTASR